MRGGFCQNLSVQRIMESQVVFLQIIHHIFDNGYRNFISFFFGKVAHHFFTITDYCLQDQSLKLIELLSFFPFLWNKGGIRISGNSGIRSGGRCIAGRKSCRTSCSSGHRICERYDIAIVIIFGFRWHSCIAVGARWTRISRSTGISRCAGSGSCTGSISGC